MINLDTLNFTVETGELDKALTKVNALAKSLGDLSAVTKILDNATRAESKARQESNAEKREAEKAADRLAKAEKKAADEAIKASKAAQAEAEKAQKATQDAAEKSEKARTKAAEKEAASRLKIEQKATADAIAEAEKQAKAAEKSSQRAAKAAQKAADAQAKAVQAAADAQVQAQTRIGAAQQATTDKVALLQERLSNTFRDIAGGFTKGESSVLNVARALGLTETQLDPIKAQLQDISKLLSNPFDSAIGSIRSINKETELLTNRMDLASQGVSLTTKQLKEFSRIQTELEASFKAGGADIVNDPDAQRLFNEQLYSTRTAYLEIAKANNAKLQSERESNVEIGRNASALSKQDQALMKVTRELERSQNAVDGLNAGLQVSNSNRLLNFERMLKSSGLATDVASQKLEKYKQNLEAVQKVQERERRVNSQRQEDFLARSLTPQLSDVAVSLYGGMPITTVLMQQGLQVRDLVEQSGVTADRMSAVLKQTGQAFVGTLSGAAVAVGSLVGGALDSAVSGIGSLLSGIAQIPDIQAGLTALEPRVTAALQAMGVNTAWLTAQMTALNAALTVVAKGSILIVITLMAAVSVAAYQVANATSAMNTELFQTGAQLGTTSSALKELAKDVDVAGTTYADVLEVFTLLAKDGNTPVKLFKELTESILKNSQTTGKTVGELVEQYNSLAEDPVKSLNELAIKNGALTQQEIDRLEVLVKSGDETAALNERTKLFTKTLDQTTAKSELSKEVFADTWATMKKGLTDAWSSVQKFSQTEGVMDILSFAVRGLMTAVILLNATLTGLVIGLMSFGSIAVGVFEDVSRGINTGEWSLTSTKKAAGEAALAFKDMGQDAADAGIKVWGIGAASREAKNAQLQDIADVSGANARAAKGRVRTQEEAQRDLDKILADANARGDRETVRAISRQKDIIAGEKLLNETRKKFSENTDKISGTNKAYEDEIKNINTLRQLGKLTAEEAVQWKAALDAVQPKNKPRAESKEIENFYNSTMKKAREMIVQIKGDTEGLTKAEIEYRKRISGNEYDELGSSQKTNIDNIFKTAIESEKLADAEERRLKLIKDISEAEQKATGFNKNFQQTIEDANELLASGDLNFDRYAAFIQSLVASQPKIKELAKIEEDRVDLGKKILSGLDEQLVKELGIADSQAIQLSLLGATEAESKKVLGLLKIRLDYEKEINDIMKDAKNLSPEAISAAALKALEVRRQKELNLNSEISFDAAKKNFEEFEKIQKDISDVLVTALTEGGKAGAAKLKDILKAALRERLTVFINAVVKDVTGGFSGITGRKLGAESGGLGTLSTLGNLASSVSSLVTVGSQVAAGTMSVVNGLSTVYANATGTGISGLLSAKSAMAAIPGWGWAAMAAAAALTIFGKKTPGEQHTGGFASTAGRTGFDAAAAITGSTGGETRDLIDRNNPQLQTLVAAGAKSVVDNLTGLAGVMGQKMNLALDLGFAVNTNGKAGNKNAFGYFGISENGAMLETAQNRDLGEDAAKAFDQLLVDANEALAKRLLGTNTELMKFGETAVQTLTRLGTNLLSVNDALDTLGATMLSASMTSAELASNIVDAFGGIENFSNATASYYQNFYSEQERTETGLRQLSTTLSKLGIALPDAAAEDALDQYRALVDQQKLNTEAGRAAYAALVTLGGGFAQLVGSTQSLAQAATDASTAMDNLAADAARALASTNQGIRDQIDVLTGAQTQRSLQLRDAGDVSTRTLLSQLFATEDLQAANEAVTAAELALANARQASADTAAIAAQTTLDSAFAAQIATIDSQREIAQSNQSAAQVLISELQGVFDTLTSNIRELYNEVLTTAAMSSADGRKFIDNALSNARSTGYLPDNKALGNAIGAVRSGMGNDQYATAVDRDRDRLVLAGKLSELAGIAQPQLSLAEQALELAKSQLLALDDQSKLLKDLQSEAKRQSEIARGISTNVEAVPAALLALQNAILRQTQARAAVATTTSTADYFTKNPDVASAFSKETYGLSAAEFANVHYNKFGANEGRDSPIPAPATAQKSYFQLYPDVAASFAEFGNGMSQGAFSATHFANFGKAEGRTFPGFAVGTNYVPKDMTARIHEGEMIIPKAFNPATSGMSMDNREVVAQLELLRFELRANVVHTSKLAKQIDRIVVPTDQGDALQVKAVV